MRDQYPGTSKCLARVSQMIQRYRSESLLGRGDLELEARFGTFDDNAFSSGVSPEFMDHVVNFVGTNPTVKTTAWREFQDSFFDVDGVEHRHRSTYNTDTLQVEQEVIIKTKLEDARLRSGSNAVRLVLSREVKVDVDTLPTLVNPKHVRIHQRKRIEFNSRGFTGQKTWLVEFGIVWSGATKTEAEYNQMKNKDPVYTIEIELLDPSYVTKHDNDYVACSMMLKVSDLMSHRAFFDTIV